MNTSPHRTLSRYQRIGVTFAVVSVFYLNVGEILQVSCVQWNLPRPYVLANLFHMFTLWSTYTEWNSAFEAEAVVVGTPDKNVEPQWVAIDIHPYLPAIHGDANRLLIFDDDVNAAGELSDPSQQKHSREYARIVDVLERCHNRAHPEMLIEQLRLYHVWWPSSRFGYFHLYEQRSQRLLYAKPRS